MNYINQRLKEEKVYRRRRLSKKHQNAVFTKLGIFVRKSDTKTFHLFVNQIHATLRTVGFHDLSHVDPDIQIPPEFTFTTKFENSFKVIREFVGAIANNLSGIVELDFSKCKVIETAPIFIMQVIRFEIAEQLSKRIRNLTTQIRQTEYKIIPSKNKNVNRLLFLCGLINRIKYDECLAVNDDNTDELEPVYRTGYYKGTKSQKHYLENKKGIITSEIVNYINNCLRKHETSLNIIGQTSLEGIISEILNNAEDHGVYNNWYVTANFSQETSNPTSTDNVIGEMNLAIMNFGRSIYDGLMDTRVENQENYDELLRAKSNLEQQFPKHGYSDESLFTLYALQEGTSRLKYKDFSRGTGTMKFINSFLKLGDFEDQSKGYKPSLSIFSGSTLIICDNNYKPFINDNVYLLTLNSEKDLHYPPKATNLVELKHSFPGTLLNVHLYISKGHLETKIQTS
jgi:hypothetical protein